MSAESGKSAAFLERSYSDRQMIMVMDDAVVEAVRAESPSRRIGIEVEVGVFNFSLITMEITKAWQRACESGLQVLPIGKSDAAHLTFPPGHPRESVVYVGHPATPKVYYTIADFHRVTFEHKFSEAINLLMHLGATSIRVEHVRGWSKEFSARLSMPLGEAGTTASGEAGATQREETQLLYKATLSGAVEPRLPESLVWYPHEPTWQSIAEGRINFGLQDFSLSVTYADDFGVNAGLKVAVRNAGLELGGQFEDHEATTWRIDGEFRPGSSTGINHDTSVS